MTAFASDGPNVAFPALLCALDRLDEVRISPIVREKDALPQTPERCGPELVALRSSLDDIVSQARSRGMNEDVGEEVYRLVTQRRPQRC